MQEDNRISTKHDQCFRTDKALCFQMRIIRSKISKKLEKVDSIHRRDIFAKYVDYSNIGDLFIIDQFIQKQISSAQE